MRHIAGKGTDLAVTGAYILAGELARCSNREEAFNHEEAFDAYERLMRPYVTKAQRLAPGVPRLAYPDTKVGVAILNSFFSLAGSKLVKSVVQFFSKDNKPAKEEIHLPDYR